MTLPDTILSAAQAIADGHLAPLDLVDGALRRIDELDGDLQAWVLVDGDGARSHARELADELARGHCRGPLHGIPLGIKDIVDVAGWPTKAGSPLRARHRADADATVVTRLRDAGAIILGKTVTTEFAGFDPPPTKNPWNVERTPGGSSSGSAAAVATGMCLGAVGSQTGGSITRPATYCGIAGCKPTFGRVSRAGVVPISVHLDHVGPMARSVADLAFLLQAMSGPDSRDPLASSEFAPDYAHALAEAGPPRLGLVEPFFLEQAQPQMRDVFLAAVDAAGGDLALAGLALGELGGLAGRGARLVVPVPGGTVTVIDESYNANPASVRATLAVLGAAPGRRIAVIGEMRELGEKSDDYHAALAGPVRDAGVAQVILVGERTRALAEALEGSVEIVNAPDAGAARERLVAMLAPGDVVLVKGSNGVGLSAVVAGLAGGKS